MAPSYIFTAKDVCAALEGVSRSHVHTWAQLSPFSATPTHERSARRFSKADILTFAVLHTLEKRFGAKINQLAQVSAGIHHYLSLPRQTSTEEWVFVPLNGGPARPVQPQPIVETGWIVDMAYERERIDIYLGIAPPQRELPLMAGIGQVGP